jgi:hypothetical protein
MEIYLRVDLLKAFQLISFNSAVSFLPLLTPACAYLVSNHNENENLGSVYL